MVVLAMADRVLHNICWLQGREWRRPEPVDLKQVIDQLVGSEFIKARDLFVI